jgi:hypothetical protein
MNVSVNGVEYQDEHDAKKAIQQAKRDEAKAEKIRQAKRAQADANAARAFVRIAHQAARLATEGTSALLVVPLPYSAFNAGAGPRHDGGYHHYNCIYETQNETGKYRHYGTIPVALLFSRNGFVLGVKFEDELGATPPQWNAVGVFEGEVWFEPIPAIIAAELDKTETWDRYANAIAA